MKRVRAKLPIFISVVLPVTSSTRLTPNAADSSNIPEFLKGVGDVIADVLNNNGFEPDSRFKFSESRLNGGYSLYTTFDYRDRNSQIILDLDIRLSDHPSKPNLTESIKRSQKKLSNKNTDYRLSNVTPAILDIYCKQRDWGLQIYFGTESDIDYRTSFDSIESFTRMLNGKITKLVAKYGDN